MSRIAKIAPTCIECWDENAVVSVLLNGQDDGTVDFQCRGCDAEFTCVDVAKKMKALESWTKTLAWVATMPNAD